MSNNTIKIIECFNINGIGLLTELQHYNNGIPPNTHIIDLTTNEIWVIIKRVHHSALLYDETEKYFECETASIHIDFHFTSQLKRSNTLKKELDKRKKGIYTYLIKPLNKEQILKPKIGSELKIIPFIKKE